jgi:hypothetical protein
MQSAAWSGGSSLLRIDGEGNMSMPTSWMPAAKMERIHIHWTGGAYDANAKDKKSYHILVQGDGTLLRGDRPINANAKGSGLTPASHTLNANTGAIGVSMCCMGGKGVTENPFAAGKFPLKPAQWDKMVEVVAELARRYSIPVTSKTILTHAEVQPNLGIKQKNKWDITRVAFDTKLVGHEAVGNKIRKEVAAKLDGSSPTTGATIPADMKASKLRVSGVKPSTLTFRDGPNGAKKGELPENTVVEQMNVDGDWSQVRTPAGFVGWVATEFLKPM